MVLSKQMIGSALVIEPSPEHAAALAKHGSREAEFGYPHHRDGPEHVITGQRMEGKTRLAMRWLLDAPAGVERVLLVASKELAECIKHEHGLRSSDKRVIGWRQLTERGSAAGVQYGIDDLMYLLTAGLKLRQTPHLVTITTVSPWQVTEG